MDFPLVQCPVVPARGERRKRACSPRGTESRSATWGAKGVQAAAVVTALFAAVACGQKAAGDQAESTNDSGATSPPATQCTWPASLDPGASPAPGCVAAVAALYCSTSGGPGEACLSNALSSCYFGSSSGGAAPSASGAGGSSTSDGGGKVCVNQCANGEYAVGCSQQAAEGGTPPVPPSTCRPINPSFAWYCCSCGK